jgi:hypothetical protein
MDLLRDLFEFTLAVVNSWAGYATGGVVVALLWLWSTLRNEQIPKRIGVAVAIFFLFAAFFNAWRIQHLAVAGLTSRIDLISKPDFEVVPTSLNIGQEALLGTHEMTVVLLTVTILNHGAPSVVKDWSFAIVRSDGVEVFGTPYLEPVTKVGNGDQNLPGLVLSSDQSLLKTATRIPIPTGGAADGYMLFMFPTMTNDEIRSPGSQMKLDIKDMANREYKYEHSTSLNQNMNPAWINITPSLLR